MLTHPTIDQLRALRLDGMAEAFVELQSQDAARDLAPAEWLALLLDREAAHLKDSLMPRYAELVYYGFWFAPEREMLQALADKSQELVTGTVRLKLYKGNASVIGRESPYSLYNQDLVTFEEGTVAYDQRDAAGFIRLNALRLRTLGQRRRKKKP